MVTVSNGTTEILKSFFPRDSQLSNGQFLELGTRPYLKSTLFNIDNRSKIEL